SRRCGRTLLLWRALTLLLRGGRLVEVAAAHAFAPFAATQHLHLVGDDVGAVAVGAGVLVLPLAGLQTALDIHGPTLLEIFAGDFGQAVVEHDPVPLGFFAAFAGGLVFPLRGRGDGNVTDGGAVRAIAHFWVASQIADKNDFID